jgi:hypothetical protein
MAQCLFNGTGKQRDRSRVVGSAKRNTFIGVR